MRLYWSLFVVVVVYVLLGWAMGNERAEAHTRTPSIHTKNAKKYK